MGKRAPPFYSHEQSWHALTHAQATHVFASNLMAIATSMTVPEFHVVLLGCNTEHMYTKCSGSFGAHGTRGNWTHPPVLRGIRARCCIDEDEVRKTVAPNGVPEPVRQSTIHREHASGLGRRYPADLVHLLRQSVPDMSEICRLFTASRQDLNGWDEIIQELTMSDDEIRLSWDVRRQSAANLGTWMHSMLEHMPNGAG